MSTDKKDYHHLIDHREPPPVLVALRNELPNHPEIFKAANEGKSFAECLAIICMHLGIVVDDVFDEVALLELCDVIVKELKHRSALKVLGATGIVESAAHRDPRLVHARIIETADSLILDQAGLIVPPIPEKLPSLSREDLDTAINEGEKSTKH